MSKKNSSESAHENFVEESAEVEGFVIQACVALIAGLCVLFSLNKYTTHIALYFSVASAVLFSVSLGLMLWNKYRRALRTRYFNIEKDKFIESFATYLQEFDADTKSQVKAKILALLNLHPEMKSLSADHLIAEAQKHFPEPGKDSGRAIVAEHWARKFADVHHKAFHVPLDEAGKGIKHFLDYVASKGRYYLFVLAIISFLVALIINGHAVTDGIKPAVVSLLS